MKKYPKWFIKQHETCFRMRDKSIEYKKCDSKWVEVYALVDSNGKLIGPIGVCPKCCEIVEIEEELTRLGYPK